MDKIIQSLTNTKVDYLAGLKSSLLIVGEELANRNIVIRPKFLVTTGEVLTDNDRKLLLQYYNAKTIDIYSSSETGNIAYTCPKSEYLHIHGDSIFINTPKSLEDLYITNLENHVTPIINYHLEDKIVYADDYECGCGSKFPLIKSIEGREGDIIISSTGRKYNSQYFTAKLKFVDDLDQYKIIQKEDGLIVIKLKMGNFLNDG
jgi:phenylacetate-CoA ligase